MKLKHLYLMVPGQHDSDLPFIAKTDIGDQEYDRETGDKASENPIENQSPWFNLNSDYFHLVLEGSIIIKKKNEGDTIVSSDYYNSSTFVDYLDCWAGMYNTPIQIEIPNNTKALRFIIDDDMFHPLSVKALTISDSSVNINTNNDTIVIVVGNHTINGIPNERPIVHYRVMDDGSANTSPSGAMAISTPDICNVVYIEKR